MQPHATTYDDNEALAIRAQKGNLEARDKLISNNMPLVFTIAARHKSQYAELDDLIQEGSIGLNHAIKKWNPQKNVPFANYASIWIWQRIIDFLQNNQLIHLPNHIKDTILSIRKQAQKSGLTEQEIFNSSKHLLRPSFIEYWNSKPFVDKNFLSNTNNPKQKTLEELIEPYHYYIPDIIEMLEPSNTIKNILDSLEPREQEIICRYYGIEGHQPHTLQDLSNIFNLSKERIRQIKENAIQKAKLYAKKKETYYGR